MEIKNTIRGNAINNEKTSEVVAVLSFGKRPYFARIDSLLLKLLVGTCALHHRRENAKEPFW